MSSVLDISAQRSNYQWFLNLLPNQALAVKAWFDRSKKKEDSSMTMRVVGINDQDDDL